MLQVYFPIAADALGCAILGYDLLESHALLR